MNTKEDYRTSSFDENFFIANAEARPQNITNINEEQARQLLDGFASPDRQPTPALIAAFEQRKRNLTRSSWSDHASRD